MPLVLMLAGGGRTLEDLRALRGDDGLRSLLHLDEMPSSDATGDWLRRMGAKESVGWRSGALTYNLCLGFRSHALASGWGRSQAQTVRWRLLQTAGKDRPLWPADVLEDQGSVSDFV